MATRVRAHKVTRNGKTYYRQEHTRASGQRPKFGMKLRPARAWFNAKRAGRALKMGKKGKAAFFGGVAAGEILGFTLFKGAGAVLVVAGLAAVLLGQAAMRRT